mgnify:CR=1 FL=1
MKGLAITLFLMAALCGYAQEQMHMPPRVGMEVPEDVRQSSLYGKSIVLFGDSYVQNSQCPIEESWHYKLAAKYNMDYHNYGLNGNCIAYDRTDEGCGAPLYQRVGELPEAADYVIVCCGHNDAVIMQRNGESPAFFRSRMEILCRELAEKYPHAKMGFVTPWRIPPDMLLAMQEVCTEYNMALFDATRHSGIHVRFRGFRCLYFQGPDDMAHLNARGHDLVAPKMEKFLLAL